MRVLQIGCDGLCERVRAAEHAPRGPFQFLERYHGLAEILERGAFVVVERPMTRTEAVGTGIFGYSVDVNGEHSFCPFSGVPRELSAFITAVRKGGPVPRALSATEALVDLKVVEAICDAAAAKSAAGTRVAA